MFQYLISDMDKNKQATLAMMHNHSRNIDEMNHRREMEQMKKEITEDVLSSINIQIEERVSKCLDDLFRDFEQKGGK